jgi:hypothetical protein
MNRPVTLAFVLAFSPLAAFAQSETVAPPETVTVESDSPVGLWKITVPRGFRSPFVGKTEWGPLTDEFCQIEKMRNELTVHCLGLRLGGRDVSRGSLSIQGSHIRMAWGSTFFYMAINGTRQSAGQFEGTLSVNALGISSDAPEQVTGTRLSVPADTPDKGGKSGLLARLLDEMAKGVVTEPLAPMPAAAQVGPGTYVRLLKPDTLQALGSVQSMIYLGRKNIAAGPTDVYDVEFANGHLICELHQAADNAIDYFDCG